MICDSTNHYVRASEPMTAVKLMRVDNDCRGEHKVVALCRVCYAVDHMKIRDAKYYTCRVCGRTHYYQHLWTMIGDA